jgi:hypothetical protein
VVKTCLANIHHPIFKITRAKRTRGNAQAIEHLLSKLEALSLNSSTNKKFGIYALPNLIISSIIGFMHQMKQ